ncbi:hypothetical protein NPIL_410291 [Nephila pilipes]|uniref:Uncharacterized protein n=1 Tax=Nephila pilipes TaxID=299642 RepID=A0A8X6UWB3_NEPPI|nr:hypothetical protein NPIL_410291 [Nephila pilipes]
MMNILLDVYWWYLGQCSGGRYQQDRDKEMKTGYKDWSFSDDNIAVDTPQNRINDSHIALKLISYLIYLVITDFSSILIDVLLSS